jgi:hypothetical protein
MTTFEVGEGPGILDDSLELKIQGLRDAIGALQETLADLTIQQQGLPESERASMDGEIKRYEDSIAINEKELERLGVDLLSRVDSTSPIN